MTSTKPINAKSVQLVQIETSEKPFFKSLKSYLLDNNTLTEVCRICFRSILSQDMVKLYDKTQEEQATKIRTMLDLVLPELDLNLYPHTVICQKCEELLVASYELKKTWLATETKLQRIIQQQKDSMKRNVNLVIVARPSNKPKRTIVQDKNSAVGAITALAAPQTVTLDKPPDQRTISVANIWGKGPFICEYCAGQYTSLKSFKYHVKQHKKDKMQSKVMCEQCGRLFLNSARLKMHSQVHKSNKSSINCCEKCGKTFKLYKALEFHIKQVHLKIYEYNQCHLCGKQFSYPTSLRIHMRSHNPQKKHSCKICDMKFHWPAKLKKHLRRHDKEKNWKCEYCGKMIKYEAALKQHIKIYHTNEAEFVCDVCNKPYWKNSDLVKHRMKIHGFGPDRQQCDNPRSADPKSAPAPSTFNLQQT